MNIINGVPPNFFDLFFSNCPADEWPANSAQSILVPWWNFQGTLFE